jgi:hypothetical protein
VVENLPKILTKIAYEHLVVAVGGMSDEEKGQTRLLEF